MLHAVAQLGQHGVGNVQRVLVTKTTPTLCCESGAPPVRCVRSAPWARRWNSRWASSKKNTILGLSRSPTSGRCSNSSLSKQEGGVQARRGHQLVGGQDIDHAQPLCVGLHEVRDVEHGFAKEPVTALLFDLHQSALDGPQCWLR